MRKRTIMLAVASAALVVSGTGTAAKPSVSASVTACYDQAAEAIVASVTWQGGRVTNGTFVARDVEALQADSIVQWSLDHGARSGTATASLGPNLGFELVTGRLYAGHRQVAGSNFDLASLRSC